MTDLFEQVAQPRIDFTSYIPPIKEKFPYAGYPSFYSVCPDCGGHKERRSIRCRGCKEASLKPPIDKSTYIIDGDMCRKIPLTKGFYATVDACEYDRLMLMSFSANATTTRKGMYPVTKVTVNERRMSIAMHRFIVDSPDKKMGDHRNGDGLDNRRKNLRPATQQENSRNSSPQRDKNTPYKGVSESARLGCVVYLARITVNGKIVWLGVFRFVEGAALAYDVAARIYFGEFARLNFPDGTDTSWIDSSRHETPHMLCTNKTGYRGVSLDKTRDMFVASITEDKKTKPIGRFKTAFEAALARDKEALRVYGSRAILNFPISA